MQEGIVILIGIVAAIYLGRKLWKTMKGEPSCSCSGKDGACSSCCVQKKQK